MGQAGGRRSRGPRGLGPLVWFAITALSYHMCSTVICVLHNSLILCHNSPILCHNSLVLSAVICVPITIVVLMKLAPVSSSCLYLVLCLSIFLCPCVSLTLFLFLILSQAIFVALSVSLSHALSISSCRPPPYKHVTVPINYDPLPVPTSPHPGPTPRRGGFAVASRGSILAHISTWQLRSCLNVPCALGAPSTSPIP